MPFLTNNSQIIAPNSTTAPLITTLMILITILTLPPLAAAAGRLDEEPRTLVLCDCQPGGMQSWDASLVTITIATNERDRVA